jgi:single-stranded DNA-specific DHH superfamily exonuclease
MRMDCQVCVYLDRALSIAGTLLYRTLLHLGLPDEKITVHHLQKGTNVHSDQERERMIAVGADRIVVLDQGSRPGRSLVDSNGEIKVLVIDHHMSNEVSTCTVTADLSGLRIR